MRKILSLLESSLETITGGKGIHFKFRRRVQSESAEPAPPPPSTTQKRAKILVVEDNRINQELTRLMLSDYEIDVDVADNGEDAFKMAKAESYDMIFMDIDMPVLNGIDATQKIKREYGARSKEPPPIVAVTALAMSGDREKLLNAGLDDYIAKPLTRSMMIYILNKYLNMGIEE